MGPIQTRREDDAGNGVRESHRGQREGRAPHARGVCGDGPLHRGAGQGRRLRGRAGLKNGAQAKRIVCEGRPPYVVDGPFAETRELVAGFSIWEVKDMDEAMAWAKRSPSPTSGRSEIEIRPFYEASDLAEFMTPEELSAPRDGERGKLGVA